MANDIQNEIEATKAKLAELESFQKVQGKLASLPADYGFSDLGSFIKALKRAATGDKVVKRGRPAKAATAPKAAAAAAPKAKKAKTGKRARITPEVKDQVKALVSAGKTGVEIAKSLGISLPSVQNVKKGLGLVKKRG